MHAAGFRHRLLIALTAAIIAGTLLTAVQQVRVVPLILEAERYEHGAHPQGMDGPAGGHDSRAGSALRAVQTAMANLVMACGFAMLLAAATTLRGVRLDGRSGLFWGILGYAVFFVAPAIGLPPELPGAQTAELAARQQGWLLAVGGAASGLAMIGFAASPLMRGFGLVLILAPHLMGAPEAARALGTVPPNLTHAFIVATAVTNALFWLVLGGTFGLLDQRWSP